MGFFLFFKWKYKRWEEVYILELIEENKVKIIIKFMMLVVKGIFIFLKIIINGFIVVFVNVF